MTRPEPVSAFAERLTRTRLLELLDVDIDAGHLRWRVTRGGNAQAGSRAGSLHSRGYVHIEIDGRQHKAHRLVWLAAHGSCPKAHLDHINGDKADNRLSNLREATKHQNGTNRSGPNKQSTSGVRGVSWHRTRRKWAAYVTDHGRAFSLGLFTDKEEAILAVESERAKRFGAFQGYALLAARAERDGEKVG